jgi:transcriptional regulator with XRE-family HTH domain
MTAGSNLRTLREKLGFTMREVEAASERLARKHGSKEYLLPISRLFDFETKGVIPSIYPLYSLAIIYRRDFRELLSWYGVDMSREVSDLEPDVPPRSHFSPVLASSETAPMPVQMHSSFGPRKTLNFSAMVEQWGAVPLMYLEQLSNAHYTYGYIGSEDLTMYPILLPGSFILVDESKNKFSDGGWRAEYERPIYFVETRKGHICSWCTRRRDKIFLEPHPLSPVPPRIFKHPEEAQVIGQVVGVTIKLTPCSLNSGLIRPLAPAGTLCNINRSQNARGSESLG